MSASGRKDIGPADGLVGPSDGAGAVPAIPTPLFIRQASDNAAASLSECFCTEIIESKPGNLRLKCGCLLHYECLLLHIRSKSSDEMRSLLGVDCPYHKAGQCCGPEGSQVITPDDMDGLVDYMEGAELRLSVPMLTKEEVSKFRRWIAEGLTPIAVGQAANPVTTSGQVSPGAMSSGKSNSKRALPSDADPTLSYITATTKPCPVCKYQATHFHGHSCHHTLEGCPSCHVEFCYKCLATEAENVTQRGSRPKCLCGGWSNFCKSNDILDNLVLVPYPHDKRCGCPICPDCRPGKKCDFCFGDCVVCRDIIRPGPSELDPDGTCSDWVPQTEAQRAAGAGTATWVAEARPAFLTVARDANRNTPPLISAIRGGRYAEVTDLLGNPATDINAVDPNGQSALQAAILIGEISIVRALLNRRELNINRPDNNGRTPLIRAAIIGNENIIRLLVERSDLDINAVDSWGLTALHCAAQRGFFGPCEWLLSREYIDVSVVDKHGCSAMDRANLSGHVSIVNLIQSHIDAFFPDGSFRIQRPANQHYIAVPGDWAPTPGSERAATYVSTNTWQTPNSQMPRYVPIDVAASTPPTATSPAAATNTSPTGNDSRSASASAATASSQTTNNETNRNNSNSSNNEEERRGGRRGRTSRCNIN